MPKINKNIKTIEIDGKKFYEREGVKLVSILDYGVEKIKGSQIQGQANIKLGFNIDSNADYTMLSGYLNNKVIPGTNEPAKDSYGDIPTGDNVYDFSRLKNNPVALIDHDNTAAGIAGNFIFLEENDQGLKFREILRPLEEIYTNGVKDVISSWANGWGRAYSIGGRWLYDMEKS
ncbi:MAG: hypothetical protein GY756_09775, partial [bacterium]|nr:hypothetical protein [bacterium]